MGTPYNIKGSASQLYYQDTKSLEYQALLEISVLPHPQRSILSTFVQDAANKEDAAKLLLNRISRERGHRQHKDTLLEFLADWICLIEKVRPILASHVPEPLKTAIWKRDGGRCCVTQTSSETSKTNMQYVFIVPPLLFSDPQMAEGTILHGMLSTFLGLSNTEHTESILRQVLCPTDDEMIGIRNYSPNILLMTDAVSRDFEDGSISLEMDSLDSCESESDFGTVEYFVCERMDLPHDEKVPESGFREFRNKFPETTLLPNSQLLAVNNRFSQALVWAKVSHYMKTIPPISNKSLSGGFRNLSSLVHRFVHQLWLSTPGPVRIFTYKCLFWCGSRLYGFSGSERIQRLPFNLYLRIEHASLAFRSLGEAETLRLVDKFTHIPAPRVLDTVCSSQWSYMLMTRIPGKPIGQMLSLMTDEKIHQVVDDLKQYVAMLRQIPNNTDSGFRICNSLGRGVLDWRIGDSRRTEFRFEDVASFHRALTANMGEHLLKPAQKSHGKEHEIVFTHGDLNPRNILVDDTGRITGIVDWECAGWYPEYWEYTKAHFVVRRTIRWLADVVDCVFEGYREELRVENMLSDAAPPW